MSNWVGPENGIMILNGVEDRKVESSHEIDFSRFRWPLIAVYMDPSDYPGYCVARVFDVNVPTNIIMLNKNLDELQSDIRKHTGMVWLSRTPEADPAVLGTWI